MVGHKALVCHSVIYGPPPPSPPLLSHSLICVCVYRIIQISHVSEQCNRSIHSYPVTVVNPLGRGGYEYVSLESHAIYLEVADLKKDISAGCEKYLEPGKDLQMGYVDPGHGKRGKQIAIVLDSDL